MTSTKIILLSGKRKSGKDFISEKLLKCLGNEKCAILRISEPIKSHFAKENNLDLVALLSDKTYKEKYRIEMIEWSDEVRKNEPGYFCKDACSKAPMKPVWIVSDIRRKTDIKWFKDMYNDQIKTVRIYADECMRKSRGFVFTTGVDDVASECNLDNYSEWDLCIPNNNEEELSVAIQKILKLINL